jgi:hypothetical protein
MQQQQFSMPPMLTQESVISEDSIAIARNAKVVVRT